MQLDVMESQKKVQSILERSGTKIREKIQEHFVQAKFKESLFGKAGGATSPSFLKPTNILPEFSKTKSAPESAPEASKNS
jgi:hypothetical protein